MPPAESDMTASGSAESGAMETGDLPPGTLMTTARLPNTGLLVDLGRQRRKRVNRLKRGEGALAWQIQHAVDRQRQELGISPDAEVVPVVLLYRHDDPDYVVVVARPAAKERE
jgi:hypothetical protein